MNWMDNTNIDNFKNTIEINTGDIITPKIKIIDYHFGNYMVKIILNNNNEFIGIKEIQEYKQFLDLKTLLSINHFDLEENE